MNLTLCKYLYRNFNTEKLNSNSWNKIIFNYRNYKWGHVKGITWPSEAL